MKTVQEIVAKIETISIMGDTSISIHELKLDSRKVSNGDVFFAIKGTTVDGHAFIDNVIKLGARVIVCETLPSEIKTDIVYIHVKDARKTCALMACNFFQNPSKKIKLVGITGTNGKTSVVTLLHQIYIQKNIKTGLISTIVNKIDNQEIPSTHTTPDPIAINALLDKMVQEKCEYAFMEVSSHAADQDRIAGLEFSGAVFMNITHDHLDYHKTFQEYIYAKKKFFDQLPETAFALTNIDDKRGEVMLQNTIAKKYTFAIKSLADFRFKILENTFNGLVIQNKEVEVHLQIIGRFNAYNLLAIYATCLLLGMDNEEALSAISTLKGAEGRFDVFTSANNTIGIVDYAHTPDALKNVLDTINEIRSHNEQVITIVGCGGNRDKTKRPDMALIASELSNKVILTSDNPRNEKAEDIIQEMKAGVPPHNYNKVMSITDRKEAIRVACNLANKKDIILLAGKGHEKYQEINGIKYDFDDKKILMQTFLELNK
ncbi:MAG TPA: UDP-N-acetylmuramoyl-L-alanyl-D-glutamate--2,6-diaminopimelate ligase [Chitinophagales bacterium]|jgi:UDP-N-acetylmuramoyl-L-alanyl-D-glutamate--2,6-diaminopimelate ligase|nr:UDP-N-acetylmuramoyl-L-alanyl-D-glutamate--2,6-diaminopimelate ligase [Chitinophagales bacterium]MBP6154403.1 UDP-N-acetylmuramoyl-L-alanyl-D-glutamate--2,6-diaminopimelate ligase [Chitinophagales bacterium]HQV77981.1 UDP-N-acetylmuramoyl-L-alanyl-D-glutamate--2,6-diaminopimelate ligase [Chitinophagales bacterium]HQW78703.1 UDP-N-acetylmuramoyl-L-alanyl-D-glutamate--2,6-diaminopimelate ligase [Chitinophagales bacterium]HRB18499.1 UDP-N-acetylmuramoyl-L-alanyl-D-glutamate--2,6-diaminopimelate